MFQELMPLLKDRTLLITVARESDTTLRATVVPKRTSEAENAALTTPLTFTGTPEEMDQEFTRALAEYVETYQRLSTTLAQAKAEMEAAAKAATDEVKRKREERQRKTNAASQPAASNSPQARSTASIETATPANLFEGREGAASPSQPGGKLCV